MKGTSRENFFFDRGVVARPSILAVRGCGIFTLEPPDREMARTVDFAEIFWPVSGSCLFRDKDRAKIIRPGTLWYYPPGSFHNYVPQETFHYCWLAVSGSYCRYFFEMLGIVPGPNPVGVCPENLFYSLGTTIDGHASHSQQITALNIAFRIAVQSRLAAPEKMPKETALKEVKKRLDAEFVDPQLTVTLLAQDSGMHRGTLSRLFHQTYGECISEYLLSLRIKQAERLLRQSTAPIVEIAAASGFKSANYFSRFFTRRYGATPTAFRKTVQQKNKDLGI